MIIYHQVNKLWSKSYLLVNKLRFIIIKKQYKHNVTHFVTLCL